MMKKRWILVVLLLIAIAAGVFLLPEPTGGKSPKKAGANGPIAVVLKDAELRDVPVWLSGIGTAQASNTVVVRPRVSGSLEKVNFVEGAMVQKGDILAEIDPRPYQSALAQAKAQKAQDEARLNNAKLDAARIKGLARQDAASQQQLELAEANVLELSAAVQSDDAAIQAAQLNLDFTTVRAPISGRTGVRLVDAGNIVTANQEAGLVVLTELQPLTVIFTLPQKYLSSLGKNIQPDAAPLKVEALSESGDLLDEGKLELIDNQIDASTGTLRLKATFKNEQLTLWPGQFVTARVLIETRKDCVVVPSEAVQPGIDGDFIYVVKSDQTVEARGVTAGIAADDDTVIEVGLNAGEKVVVVGQSKLKPGSKVSPKEEEQP
ncbi:efflux RND transporter periplasmic adaptor subunit [Luteolibacter pohnpeiensis]|uniref:Efflux RND transporter periplasmic adaptor subunit n=2 Tax=Luteolibacter pohnpeiensis TaxID=454153 RepID=A0A934S6M8_9BACT|nr:efflux RND transporter periplasmic adaptor subunit [Luteolibacter pohnpeiensis]